MEALIETSESDGSDENEDTADQQECRKECAVENQSAKDSSVQAKPGDDGDSSGCKTKVISKGSETENECSVSSTKKTICRFFRGGFCKNGNNCAASHDAADSARVPIACKFYSRGCCGKGDNCAFLHGEYPCKDFFISGFCPQVRCRFSHSDLTPYASSIVNKVMNEEGICLPHRTLLPLPDCSALVSNGMGDPQSPSGPIFLHASQICDGPVVTPPGLVKFVSQTEYDIPSLLNAQPGDLNPVITVAGKTYKMEACDVSETIPMFFSHHVPFHPHPGRRSRRFRKTASRDVVVLEADGESNDGSVMVCDQ